MRRLQLLNGEYGPEEHKFITEMLTSQSPYIAAGAAGVGYSAINKMLLRNPVISVDPAEVGESRLVGANRAIIDPRKLTEYALNPEHPVGGNKAVVFDRLGFNQSNAGDLMSQLRSGVMEMTPIPGKVDEFGARFTVDIPVVGPRAAGIVRTGWIYKGSSTTPELTTLFVK
jgi:hypothetical protein